MTTQERFQQEILRLSKLGQSSYEFERKKIADEYDIRIKVLDDLVIELKKQNDDNSQVIFPNIEPWPEQVEAAILLTEIEAILNRFIVFPSKHEAKAIALYIVHTHCIEAFDCSPILNISSPEPRCGKSNLLAVLKRLVCRALLASNISPAALYRSVEKWVPTIMIDEADACLRDKEELRGLINSGHTRDSAFTLRCEGDSHEPTPFNTFCPKIIDGIGSLAETIEDRSVIIKLRRKLSVEIKDKLRDVPKQMLVDSFRKCLRFAKDNIETLKQSKPIIPEQLNDRAADNWFSLLAIAELGGNEWTKWAKEAALHLSDNNQETVSTGIELLQDIKSIFEEKKTDRIATADLLEELCRDGEAPWATYNRGKPISPRQLAKRLKDYKINSRLIRQSYDVKRGYLLEDFEDAFKRYIPSLLPPSPSVTTLQPAIDVASVTFSQMLQNQNVTDEKTSQAAPVATCSGVTDKKPSLEGVPEENKDYEVF